MDNQYCFDDETLDAREGFSAELLHRFKDRKKLYEINRKTASVVKSSDLDVKLLQTKIGKGITHSTASTGAKFTFENGKFYCETKEFAVQCAFCPEIPCNEPPERFHITCSKHYKKCNMKWEMIVYGEGSNVANLSPTLTSGSEKSSQSSIPLPDVSQSYDLEYKDEYGIGSTLQGDPIASTSYSVKPVHERVLSVQNNPKRTNLTNDPSSKSSTLSLRSNPYPWLNFNNSE